MKASELRIGNYRQTWIAGRQVILAFELADFFFPDKIESDEPIPLTEEWLLRFGFEENKIHSKKNGVLVMQLKGFKLKKFARPMSKFFFEWDLGTRTYISEIHQLQNLYFSLECRELELKKA